MFKKEIYQERRDKLKKLVQSGLIILPANSVAPFTSRDECFPFRQDSSFLYFTGIDTPDCYVLLDIDNDKEWVCGADDPAEAVFWTGKTPSVSDYGQKSGINNHGPLSIVTDLVDKAAKSGQSIHYLPPYQASVCLKLQELFGFNQTQLQESVSTELIKAVIKLRSVKDELEIKEIEAAVNIAHRMHSTAMIMAMPGAHEQDIKGVIEGIAVSKGGALSFQPIVTIRGDILHNPKYTNTLESDSLLIVDAGAETAMHYASDITRTIPVGKSFTRMQRAVYEVALKANQDAIAAIKPGIPFFEVHWLASVTIASGLKDLGLMKGDPEEAVNQGAHALFFPHGLGHMLGLDTHDMDSLGEDAVGYSAEFTRSEQFGLKSLRLAKSLETGNVITVEPGIYFIDPLIDAWKRENMFVDFINYNQVELYRGMGGIRIEDDVLVTETGVRILGDPIPKSVKELEDF